MFDINSIVQNIEKNFPSVKFFYDCIGNDIGLEVSPQDIINVMAFLKGEKSTSANILIDICAVDYLGRDIRFDVLYQLLSLENNLRIVVKTSIDVDLPIESIGSIFSSAGWYEREIWDMYGIPFLNHTDFRRILTDYDFHGFPQRKDFPLSGYIEVKYNNEKGKVDHEHVCLEQEFRGFDLESPWGNDVVIQKEEEAE